MIDLRKKRAEYHGDIGEDSDDTELNKSVNQLERSGSKTPTRQKTPPRRQNTGKKHTQGHELSQVNETNSIETSTRVGADLLSRHKFDLDSDTGTLMKQSMNRNKKGHEVITSKKDT